MRSNFCVSPTAQRLQHRQRMTSNKADNIDGCVVITGGTGSFGRAFTRYLLANTDAKIRIVSRDEAKQEDLQREFPDSRLTFILGDLRGLRKLASAVDGATVIVHAAALKRVAIGERQADEFVKTNVNGTANVIDAALLAGGAGEEGFFSFQTPGPFYHAPTK